MPKRLPTSGDRSARRTAGLLGCALLLGACAHTLPPPETATDLPVPATWREVIPDDGPLASDATSLALWWRQLDDPTLDALVDRVLAGNLDLATAGARLAEARARRGVARAPLYPSVGASASAAERDVRADGDAIVDSYAAALEISWEVDLFGANRLAAAASRADFEATVEELRATRVALLADTVAAYVDLRVAEAQLAILERSLAGREETWQLTAWREQAGLASALDVAQTRGSLEQARAGLPTLAQSAIDARLRLELLAGEPPGGLDALLPAPAATPGALPRPPAEVAAGIPVDCLRQRPDVRAAERALAAALARQGAARAERFPTLRLSGSLDAQSLSARDLFDAESLVGNLLAGLTAPLFEGGRIRQNIAIQDAVVEQAALAYRGALLTALSEVEAALSAYGHTQKRLAALEAAAAAAVEAADLADQRYAAGLIDLLTVLETQRTRLAQDEQLAAARGALATDFATLYRALGGGWTAAATGAPDA